MIMDKDGTYITLKIDGEDKLNAVVECIKRIKTKGI